MPIRIRNQQLLTEIFDFWKTSNYGMIKNVDVMEEKTKKHLKKLIKRYQFI